MNKKGFTLIELLGVVTLIVILSLIAIPNILHKINDKKIEISEANMLLLASATDVYIENNPINYTYTYEANGSVYCIPIQSLVDDGVLTTPFTDINGKEIDYSQIVKATYQAAYNGFSYDLVERGECTEVKNYVSRPQLSDNMIPVVYDTDGSAWVKADVNSKWYNYLDKNWANAVLVREVKGSEEGSNSRYWYKNAPSGTIINESDILAYFVWIPRFRYQLFDSNDVTTINIAFESVTTPKSQGTAAGQWLTHPAFTYNNQELSGIWVAKYETSNQDNNLVIKSSLTPWTNIGYNDSFSLSNSMVGKNNIYGLSGVNTHLIQNNEWSAVTYLTQSVYGLNDEVNTNSSTTTGGTNSTTGNIYGIYDMAGLSNEFVTITGENENSLGYSLGETKTWYGDTNSFITDTNSYLSRGGTSIFNYNATNVRNANTSFRPVVINNEVSSTEQKTSLQYAYQNISTNSYYSTLQDAFTEVHDGDTIKVIRSITDTSTPELSSDKTVKFDLAGKEIILNKAITNNGTMDIYSSVDGGVLSGSVTVNLINNGILSLNDTDKSHTLFIYNSSTSATSTHAIISNYGTATLNDNVTLEYTNNVESGSSYRYVVLNFDVSVAILNGATLINKVGNTTTDRGILNLSTSPNSSIIVNSGIVDTLGLSLANYGSLKNTLSDPAIKVNGGTITSAGIAIYNSKADSMVYVTGGTIQGIRGVYNDSSGIIYISGTPTITGTEYQAIRGYTGNVTIEGGSSSGPVLNGYTDGVYLTTADNVSGSAIITGHVEITGQTQYGIQAGADTTVTIGVDDGSVSTTYPYIFANTSNRYGVYVHADGTFNFYDGKIVGYTNRAINRDPDDTPDGYTRVNTAEGTNQIVTLGAS